MNFLLNADINNTTITENPMEILALGGQTVLIGMLTVFAVLGIIWACLMVFKFVFHDMPANKKAPVVVESAPVVATEEVAVSTADDGEIIAVIAAAIAAAESEVGGTAKFRVVSFRRR